LLRSPLATPQRFQRPSGDPGKNFTTAFVIDPDRERKQRRSKQLRLPRVVRLLEQAVELKRLVDTRQVGFRADLARRSGLSAMRVTQILALLELAPSVLAYVRSLDATTPERLVTERRLRTLTHLPPREQVQRATKVLPGFASFIARRAGEVA
jgi:hypothetical protein